MAGLQLSVGKPRRCQNLKHDVMLVQKLLRGAATKLGEHRYDGGTPTGAMNQTTLRAIEAFQGKIDAVSPTW